MLGPGEQLGVQDVYNHMGEALEQKFKVFEVETKDDQYQLDVKGKIKESFQNIQSVISNFRIQSYVKGGGCEILVSLVTFLFLNPSVIFSELFRSTKQSCIYLSKILVPRPLSCMVIDIVSEIQPYIYGTNYS